jgi:NAD-dependent SIR2 family protein deacetylase
MEKEKTLFTVSCVHCNEQIFQFSRNLLEETRKVILHCPKCGESTQVVYDSADGVTIRAF